MTFKELMLEQTGYECFTTFFEDFTIADTQTCTRADDGFRRKFDWFLTADLYQVFYCWVGGA